MLEIFIIITLCRKIEPLAILKGQRVNRWKLWVVLAWFFAEFLGAFIGYMITNDTILSVILFGYPAAYVSYMLVKKRLSAMPDKDDWAETIGSELNN